MKNFLRVFLVVCLAVVCLAAFSSCDQIAGLLGGSTTAPATTTEQSTTESVTTTAPVTTTEPVTTTAPVTTTTPAEPAGPTGSEIGLSTLTLNGTTVSGTVSNSTGTFSFIPEVTVAEGATYKITTDMYGRDVVYSKTVQLIEGDNTFYILVENGNDIGFYTVTIRRRPMYTVTVDYANGTTPITQKVEEGEIITAETPSRDGIAFLGWSGDVSAPITSNVTFTAEWAVIFKKFGNEITGLTNYGKALSTLEIPVSLDGVAITGIGDRAFEGCTGLTSIVIPDSVTSIGYDAFYGCTGLTSIVIPDSVTSIGEVAFYGCTGLTSITVAEGNTVYHSEGNCLIETATKTLILGLKNSTIPTDGSVTSIGEVAFYGCTGLTSIVIPDSVTSIGVWAFYGCTGLTSIVIPDSVTSIGVWAFCDCDGLTSVYITDLAAWCNISFGNSYANPLYCAENLYLNGELVTELVIPNSVTSIGEHAFASCDGLTSVEIPDSVTSIGEHAFASCDGLTSVEIPDSVTSIGSDAFSFCSKLTIYCEAASKPSGWDSYWKSSRPVVWDYQNNDVASDGYIYVVVDGLRYGVKNDTAMVAGQSSTITAANIPAMIEYGGKTYSVTSIGSYAFYGCGGLTSVVIPDSVTSIGDSAFSGCSSLTSVVIPDSVTSIGDSAFSGCSSLTSVVIPDSVTSIGSDAFYGCTGLTSIVIPDSVTSIGVWAFSGCSSLTSVVIPDSVTSIGSHAFAYCDGLTSVVIPDSVTSIGGYAFDGCTGLTSITVAERNTVYHSEGNCLIKTATKTLILGLKNSTIPTDGSVTSIGYAAFYGCTGLTSIVIPDSVTSIGGYAFDGCDGLTSVVIPDSVTSIGDSAFYGCTGLTSIVIPDSVTSIGYYAFYGCSGLTSVTFKNTVGWKAGITSLSSASLANKSTAATYLESTYYDCTWTRR